MQTHTQANQIYLPLIAGNEEQIPVPVQEPPDKRRQPPLKIPDDLPTTPLREPPVLPGTLPPTSPPGTEVEPLGDPVRLM